MKNIKIIKGVYILYGLYMLLIYYMSNLGFIYLILTWFVLLFCYFSFKIGYCSANKSVKTLKTQISYTSIFDNRSVFLIISSILVVAFSVINALFYTGQSPSDVLKSINTNQSTYYIYQFYSLEKNIGAMSAVKKLPYIFTQYYNAIMLYYTLPYIIYSKHALKTKVISSLLISIGIAYFGLARGTSFEIFQLVVVFLFIILRKTSQNNHIYSLKKITIVVLCIMGGIFFFITNLSSRGIDVQIIEFPNIDYDENGLFPSLFGSLSFPIARIYGYFGFGQYYNAYYIYNICLGSFKNLILVLFPGGLSIAGINDIKSTMDDLIQVGVKWDPDFSVFSANLGLVFLFLMIFVFGRVSKTIEHASNTKYNYFIELIILIQMMSFPIGKFMILSGYMEMIGITVIILYLFNYKRKTKK